MSDNIEGYNVFELRAMDDYDKVKGRVILASRLTGCIGDSCCASVHSFDPPIAVRVVEGRVTMCWCGNWLDTCWDVTIVDTLHPQLPAGGLQACYVYGTSYHNRSGAVGDSHWRLETCGERWRRRWRWLVSLFRRKQ